MKLDCLIDKMFRFVFLMALVPFTMGTTYDTSRCSSYSDKLDRCACYMKKQVTITKLDGYEFKNKYGNHWRPLDDVFWASCERDNRCVESFYYNNCNGCAYDSCLNTNIEVCFLTVASRYRSWFYKPHLRVSAKCGKNKVCSKVIDEMVYPEC